jgi:chemotaxis protein CheX
VNNTNTARAPQSSPVPNEKVRNDLIDAFTEAATKTIEVQCQTRVKPMPTVAKSKANAVGYDIAATMGLMSKSTNGAVALGFGEETFLKIIGKMLGESFDGISTEVEDGCAELLNIVFGQAKKVLNERGYQFGKTLPSTFIGHTLRVRQLTPQPATLLPFETEFGMFYVEIGMRGQ